jgi:hypothetical protein
MNTTPLPSPTGVAIVEVFTLRAQTRALLWAAGELDMHAAVDKLEQSAETSGLIAAIGQDAVQAIMSEAFAAVHDDLPTSDEPTAFADEAWSTPSWREAAVEYHKDRSNRASVTPYMADELARPRGLMANDVSLDRAYAELNKRAPGDVPIATLQAAEYLAQQNDPQRLDDWLRPRSPDDCAAIRKHLGKRRGPS